MPNRNGAQQQQPQEGRPDPMTGMTGLRRDLLNYGFGGAIVLLFAWLLITGRSDVLAIFSSIRQDHREDRDAFTKAADRHTQALDELRHNNAKAIESLDRTMQFVGACLREVKAIRAEQNFPNQSFAPPWMGNPEHATIPRPEKEKL